MSLRKIIIQVHLLLGLFIFPYLIIFGITSLNFNHGWFNSYEFGAPTVEVTEVEVPAIQDSLVLATAIRDSLGLFGYVFPRETYIDKGILHTRIQHLGKRQDLKVDIGNGKAEIKVSKRTFMGVLSGLHGLGEVLSGAPWHIKAWKYYQLVSVYVMVFWIFSGLYLWLISKQRKKWETYFLLGFTSFAILLMVWLWQG